MDIAERKRVLKAQGYSTPMIDAIITSLLEAKEAKYDADQSDYWMQQGFDDDRDTV